MHQENWKPEPVRVRDGYLVILSVFDRGTNIRVYLRPFARKELTVISR